MPVVRVLGLPACSDPARKMLVRVSAESTVSLFIIDSLPACSDVVVLNCLNTVHNNIRKFRKYYLLIRLF